MAVDNKAHKGNVQNQLTILGEQLAAREIDVANDAFGVERQVGDRCGFIKIGVTVTSLLEQALRFDQLACLNSSFLPDRFPALVLFIACGSIHAARGCFQQLGLRSRPCSCRRNDWTS